MTTFPKLKTNAVAQYPARRATVFHNQALRFIDGREQRYRDCPGPLHRWEVRLDQLDEREMARIGQFFAENQGAFGNFEFVDPWDNRTYSNCSLEADLLELTSVAEMNGTTVLVVRENRS
jgi:hypothetical protein